MDDAFMVFNAMPARNLTSWHTMMTWLANNGLGEDAIDLFTQFMKIGMKPDVPMLLGSKELGTDVLELHFVMLANHQTRSIENQSRSIESLQIVFSAKFPTQSKPV